MLADLWVIALILIQLFSILLFLPALNFSIASFKNWNINSAGALQIALERRTYLISTGIKYILLFQLISFILFLSTVNNYLPGIISGAMCATGTLSINQYGYTVLFLKSCALLIYIIFLFINYLDLAEPNYPLTPAKYYVLLPVFLLLVIDSLFTLLYFSNIQPNIIASCCSVDYSKPFLPVGFGSITDNLKTMLLTVYYGIAVVLVLSMILRTRYCIVLIEYLVFAWLAVYLLKYHFVKYIYGLPSHNCLFDIFWAQYYYLGYILFGLLFLGLIFILMLTVLQLLQQRLAAVHFKLIQFLRSGSLASLLIYMLLVTYFWLRW